VPPAPPQDPAPAPIRQPNLARRTRESAVAPERAAELAEWACTLLIRAGFDLDGAELHVEAAPTPTDTAEQTSRE
jgi:hypothetical protein